jgi:hypothetical protein
VLFRLTNLGVDLVLDIEAASEWGRTTAVVLSWQVACMTTNIPMETFVYHRCPEYSENYARRIVPQSEVRGSS